MIWLPQKSICFNKICTWSVFWHYQGHCIINICKFENLFRFFRFPDFSLKNKIFGDFGTDFPIGTQIFQLILYRVTKLYLLALLKNKWRLYRFPFFRYEGFNLIYDFHWNRKILQNYDVIRPNHHIFENKFIPL